PGFQVRDALMISFDLNLQNYPKERAEAFRTEALDRVGSLPGVRSVTLASVVPLSGRMVGAAGSLEGQTGPSDMSSVVLLSSVYPGYFRTLGIPLLKGRDFSGRDREGSPRVIIVNETLARRFWPDQDPLGKRFSLSGPRGELLEVVGVARDSKVDE